jgi:hypothetical protein
MESWILNRLLCACLASAATFTFCCLPGCGKSSSNDTASSPAQAAPAPNTDAVARAAADFLDAVLKGDTQRASARLTPQAMQRIIASGKQFAPPGLETATFRIGQVRAPSKGQALVQCVLTDNSVSDSPRNEEMCCLMRFVENDWRVSGIAYGTSADQPWTLSDFETGKNIVIPRQPSIQSAASQPVQPVAPSGRPSPPQTAQEQAPIVR